MTSYLVTVPLGLLQETAIEPSEEVALVTDGAEGVEGNLRSTAVLETLLRLEQAQVYWLHA